jgi:hypothetical protein
MAKMFYTLEETKAALGQSEDQIKQLTREGRLREFRDGPRLMFKSDQVDALKAQIGGGSGAIDFADSGVPLSLADTGGGSGTAIGLADTGGSGLGSGVGSGMGGSGLAGISGSGLGSGLVGGGAGSGMMNLKDDTALAADLGLSGTVGGIPSPGRSGVGSGGAGAGTGMSGSVGSRQGINVFGDDTHLPVDPMAQTAMPGLSSGGSGADLDLQGIGSGSGLLDLTRESDDTSLGAELLDEITPSKRPQGPPDTGSMAGVRLEAPRGGVVRGTAGVNIVEAVDPWAGAFGGLALGAGLFLLFPLFALIAAAYGVVPPAIGYFNGTPEKPMDNAFVIIIIIGLVVSLLFFAFGKLIQMSSRR